MGSRPWGPPQDLPRTGPFAIEVVLKFRQNPAPVQNRDSDQLDGLRDHLDSLGGRKGLIGQPARRQGGTREAGKDHFGHPARHQGGTGKAGPTACEAPSKHQGGRKGPTGHQGGTKGPFGEPGRHQGGTREAGKD